MNRIIKFIDDLQYKVDDIVLTSSKNSVTLKVPGFWSVLSSRQPYLSNLTEEGFHNSANQCNLLLKFPFKVNGYGIKRTKDYTIVKYVKCK